MVTNRTGFSPSVLSALYSTVIPEYEKNLQQGENQEETLDHALILVNNVSRKKLMASLPSLLSTLAAMDVPALPHKGYFGNPFLSARQRHRTLLRDLSELQHLFQWEKTEDRALPAGDGR